MVITKTEVVSRLSQKTGLSHNQSLRVINALFDSQPGQGIIGSALDSGDRVVIPGFGTFGTRERAARTCTNPSTGEAIEVKERHYVFFRPGKTLRDRIIQ